MMEAFESQRALLEYLGKNPNDRSLVQRLIKRWRVYKEWGMYYFVGDGLEIKEEVTNKSDETVVEMDNKELLELKAKNEKIVAAYKSLKERYERLMEEYKKVNEKASAEWGLYDHLVFFYWKFKDWKKFVDGKVFGQTQYDISKWMQQTEEAVRPWMYEKYKFKYDEVEEAECAAVEKIINKRAEELGEIPF